MNGEINVAPVMRDVDRKFISFYASVAFAKPNSSVMTKGYVVGFTDTCVRIKSAEGECLKKPQNVAVIG